MAAFKFKFQTLHRLKSQIEDQAKNRFGLAVTALNTEISKLNCIKNAINATVDEFRELSGGRFTAGKIRDYNYFISTMKEKAAIQQKAVEEAMRVVNKAREELIAAVRQREMFDKLRDKAFIQYMDDEKRAENRVVDEIVSYRGNYQDV